MTTEVVMVDEVAEPYGAADGGDNQYAIDDPPAHQSAYPPQTVPPRAPLRHTNEQLHPI